MAQRILRDNQALHDAPGYAEFYDRACGVVAHPHERASALRDLRWITQRTLTPDGSHPSSVDRPLALDVACGTGNLTLALLGLGWRVVAVDLSAQMLSRLRARAQDALATGQLRLVHAPADDALGDWPQSHPPVQLACASSALHHMPDWRHTLANMARVTAAGGWLYVTHEPLAPADRDPLGQALSWLDFKLHRVAVRLPAWTGLRQEDDPFWADGCLADYWTGSRGIDRRAAEAVARSQGLQAATWRYPSCRHRLVQALAHAIRAPILLKMLAQRPTMPCRDLRH